MTKRDVPKEYFKFKECMIKYSNRECQLPYHTAKMVLAWYGVCSDKRMIILNDMINKGILKRENKRCLTILNPPKKSLFL